MKRQHSDARSDVGVVRKKRRLCASEQRLTDWLPLELWHAIAKTDEQAYRALLALPEFARSLSVNSRIDYRLHFGHSVRITFYSIQWKRLDEYHRLDGPALECPSGDKFWYRDGKRHRDDGPATEADGVKYWYRHGELHRDDGPAIEWADGSKVWYRDGDRHRDDGPAVEYASGDKEWWRHGKLHREDGPAVERSDGDKEWWRDGKRHRDDGPAVERADGDKEWWRDGHSMLPSA